jgi:hypothetical protein
MFLVFSFIDPDRPPAFECSNFFSPLDYVTMPDLLSVRR